MASLATSASARPSLKVPVLLKVLQLPHSGRDPHPAGMWPRDKGASPHPDRAAAPVRAQAAALPAPTRCSMLNIIDIYTGDLAQNIKNHRDHSHQLEL